MKNIHDQNTSVFIKAYRSFLKSEGKMTVDQITQLYKDMEPSLHTKASSPELDIEAFMYSFLRLPRIMNKIKKVVMAQTDEIFLREGYKIEFWEEVHAPARRRKMYYDGEDTLAVFINSVTDVDDVVCLLTAFQIEWNKAAALIQKANVDAHDKDQLKAFFKVEPDHWERLMKIWGDKSDYWLQSIASQSVDYHINLLRGSYVDYKKAAQRWFEHIIENTRYSNFHEKPLYFVSSNTHSLVNNITGWVVKLETELIHFLKEKEMNVFLDYWKEIENGEHPGSRENFLWYILKKYEQDNPKIREQRHDYEKSLGIDYIEAKHYLDIDTQVLSLQQLSKSNVSQKLGRNLMALAKSDGYILNIDYPLGSGAYMVLSTILQNAVNLRGVYILGKASFLNGNLGDIGLPSTIYDTYSENTYIFDNAFTKDFFADFEAGSILTDQKVVSSKGTLLHPLPTVQQYFMNNYTIIEMENGPYLNALYETTHFDRYPEKQTINLLNSKIDIGIIHYASDTPFTKAITLGTRNLGYEGVEATYVSSLAILKRIIDVESSRINS